MRIASLFSGIGGLDKGFSDIGFDVIWANDNDKYAVETYKANYKNEIVYGDINNISLSSIPDFDILIWECEIRTKTKQTTRLPMLADEIIGRKP